MRKVAITGGLCCGKSTVCKMLQEKGAYVVSADAIVHQLLSSQSPVKNQLIALFGEEVICDNQFDRRVIAKKVFNEESTLRALESILHPVVLEEIEKQYNQVQNNQKYTIFVAEIPLLYEIDKAHLFDKVIAVIADPKIAKKRFQKNNLHTAEEFEKRMTHQLSGQEKSALADFTITNDADLSELRKQVDILYQQLT